VTDADSHVVVIDLRTGSTVGDVSTGGADNLRADELAYDLALTALGHAEGDIWAR
jgi:hypothetical protein